MHICVDLKYSIAIIHATEPEGHGAAKRVMIEIIYNCIYLFPSTSPRIPLIKHELMPVRGPQTLFAMVAMQSAATIGAALGDYVSRVQVCWESRYKPQNTINNHCFVLLLQSQQQQQQQQQQQEQQQQHETHSHCCAFLYVFRTWSSRAHARIES